MRSYHNTNELLHTLLFQKQIIHVVYTVNQRFYADNQVFTELRYEVQEIYNDNWHEIDFDPQTIKKLEKDLKNCLSDEEKQKNKEVVYNDNYLSQNIKEAKEDFNKACDLYRNYVGASETHEERLRRINLFRSGGC